MSDKAINKNYFFSGLKMFKNHYTGSMVDLPNLPLVKQIVLTQGRIIVNSIYAKTTGLYKRYRLLNNFYSRLVKMYSNHGVDYTIRYLKANQLAIQKKIAGTPFNSLRDVEPNLPLPRLSSSGLPIWMSPKDRQLVRSDSYLVIRLWLTLFGIYRIFKCPPKGQIDTIISPFTGSFTIKDEFSNWIRTYGIMLLVNNLKKIPSIQDLEVKQINWLLTSGPVSKVSFLEIFTDLFTISHNKVLFECILEYINRTSSVSFKMILKRIGVVVRNLSRTSNVMDTSFLKKGFHLFDVDNPLGRLSFKEEANGKVRVFAMVDIITQSLFTPLHNRLFEICRELKTDSLFDQNQAFKRCLDLSVKYGCSWGFDLSAATDRLPIDNQAAFLDALFGKDIGTWWSRILTWRDFLISSNEFDIKNYYNLSMKVRYSVGQPMGALSSWAMLNLIHHMMVQYSSFMVKPVTGRKYVWFDNYQILGDDLVIFEKEVAEQYQELCLGLGVNINLKKSILAPSRPVVEFAKRTGLNGHDVSALSFKELLSSSGFFGKFNFFNQLVKKGFIKSNKFLNTFLVLTRIENKTKNYPYFGLLAYLLQVILSDLPNKTFGVVGPLMNNGSERMHYFGKSIYNIDETNIKKSFLKIFNPKISIKLIPKREGIWWTQETLIGYILLYQNMFKIKNLFTYRHRFLQFTQGFIDSFKLAFTDIDEKILTRIYRDQFLVEYNLSRDKFYSIPYDYWKPISVERLLILSEELDSCAQRFGFYNFNKETKVDKLENPFSKIWFFQLLNSKNVKNLQKAIMTMVHRGDFIKGSRTLALFTMFNYSNLMRSMEQGFKKVFSPPVNLRRRSSDPNLYKGKNWFWSSAKLTAIHNISFVNESDPNKTDSLAQDVMKRIKKMEKDPKLNYVDEEELRQRKRMEDQRLEEERKKNEEIKRRREEKRRAKEAKKKDTILKGSILLHEFYESKKASKQDTSNSESNSDSDSNSSSFKEPIIINVTKRSKKYNYFYKMVKYISDLFSYIIPSWIYYIHVKITSSHFYYLYLRFSNYVRFHFDYSLVKRSDLFEYLFIYINLQFFYFYFTIFAEVNTLTRIDDKIPKTHITDLWCEEIIFDISPQPNNPSYWFFVSCFLLVLLTGSLIYSLKYTGTTVKSNTSVDLMSELMDKLEVIRYDALIQRLSNLVSKHELTFRQLEDFLLECRQVHPEKDLFFSCWEISDRCNEVIDVCIKNDCLETYINYITSQLS